MNKLTKVQQEQQTRTIKAFAELIGFYGFDDIKNVITYGICDVAELVAQEDFSEDLRMFISLQKDFYRLFAEIEVK